MAAKVVIDELAPLLTADERTRFLDAEGLHRPLGALADAVAGRSASTLYACEAYRRGRFGKVTTACIVDDPVASATLDYTGRRPYPEAMTATEWQAVAEANEGSFTVDLPAGWKHDVRMLRFGTEQRRVVQAASPDGTVQLFAHDPELPSYYEPGSGMFVSPPLQQVAPYVNAEGYVSDYLRARFGGLPGFRPMRRRTVTGFESRSTHPHPPPGMLVHLPAVATTVTLPRCAIHVRVLRFPSRGCVSHVFAVPRRRSSTP